MKRQGELPEEMQTDDPERECMKSFSMEEPQLPYSVDLKDEILKNNSRWKGRSRAENSLFRRLSRVINRFCDSKWILEGLSLFSDFCWCCRIFKAEM